MIRRRIHTLKAVALSSQEPYEDENGNIVFPPIGESREIERSCRAESNTVDGRKMVKDGVNYDYSYLIFTDTGIDALPMGTKVSVTVDSDSSVFGEGEVLKFERGQRVTRIWLK